MGVFAMPSLGADMEAGTLVEWLVKPGDTVKRGDVVAVVETQKGAIEIECFEVGTVTELTAELGQELPVGAPLAVIGEAGAAPEAAPQPAAAAPEPLPASEPEAPSAPTAPEPPPAPPPGGAPAASPAARMRAKELGRDLDGIAGSGPGGAIVLADVEAAAQAAAAPAKKTRASPMEEMRKAIAAAMSRSKRTIPHFYLSQTIDLQPASDWLERRNAGSPPTDRLLMGALFVRAAVLAAAQVNALNGHYTEDGFRPAGQVNPGVAIALRGGGLVAPAILDAQPMGVDAIMAGMRDLVTRARAGRLRGREMTEGTITVSALGESGAEAMAGIIFPPQVALVALGAPQKRPWIAGSSVVPRLVGTVTIAADHRVADGRQAARFLAEFESRVLQPEAL